MAELLSKGQIDKLGKVIRNDHLSDEEWTQFETLRRRCDEVAIVFNDQIRGVILESDIDITSRFKNIETIREKLRRSPMRLSQMRDLIGFRIVAPGGRIRQDEIAAKLSTQFQDHGIKSIDRRRDPIHGYRALHLEVEFDGAVIEIQIRTLLQHEWAEAFERLADICGRGIRYGEPPQLDHLDPSLREEVQTCLDLLARLSKIVDRYEIAWLRLNHDWMWPHDGDGQSVRVSGGWTIMRNKIYKFATKLGTKFGIEFDPDEDHRVILEIIVDLKKLLTEIRKSLG